MKAQSRTRRCGGRPSEDLPARVIWNPASGGGGRGPEDLALLPTGTGNDLARTLAVPADPEGALAVLRRGAVRKLDAVRLQLRGSGEHFFVNAAVGGLGAEVSREAAHRSLKARWGRLAYPRAYLSTRARAAHRVRVTLDGEEREFRAANVVVGNGRYAGGGMPAAPGADPGDGLLDVVAVEHTDPLGLLSTAAQSLLRGDGPNGEGVFSASARRILLEAEPPLEFNTDGELAGTSPAEFEALPRALNVVVGPGYCQTSRQQAGLWPARAGQGSRSAGWRGACNKAEGTGSRYGSGRHQSP